MGAIVRVEGLEKTFGARRVLHGLDLHAEPGDAIVLLGDNGSGKTTLLRILATLSKPTGGRVLVGTDDPEQAGRGSEVRRNIGFVAHHPLVWDDLTLPENVVLAARAAGATREAADAAAAHWLERVGLAARARDRTGTLSRGMKQRLALARALAPDPPILLLDEPTTALDASSRTTLAEILRSIQGAKTVIVATHDAQWLAGWATRTLRLSDGRLTEVAA